MAADKPNIIFLLADERGYDSVRANSFAEEPSALVPHAGICEETVGQLAILPR